MPVERVATDWEEPLACAGGFHCVGHAKAQVQDNIQVMREAQVSNRLHLTGHHGGHTRSYWGPHRTRLESMLAILARGHDPQMHKGEGWWKAQKELPCVPRP